MNHRMILRVFIISAIVLPTLYFLVGPAVDSAQSLGIDGSQSGGTQKGYGPRGVARKMREWSGAGKKQWFGSGSSSMTEDEDDDEEDERGSRIKGDEVMLDLEEEMPVSTYDGGMFTPLADSGTSRLRGLAEVLRYSRLLGLLQPVSLSRDSVIRRTRFWRPA